MNTRSMYDYERKTKLSDNSTEIFGFGQGSRCDTMIAKTYYDNNDKKKNGFKLTSTDILELDAFTDDEKEKLSEDLVFNIGKDDPLYLPLSKALFHGNIVLEDESIKKSPKSLTLSKNGSSIKIKFTNKSDNMINAENKWNLKINISTLSEKICDNGKCRLLRFFTDAQNVYFDMDKKEKEEEKEEKQAKEYAKLLSYPSIQVTGVM